jgi:hypothetical protein
MSASPDSDRLPSKRDPSLYQRRTSAYSSPAAFDTLDDGQQSIFVDGLEFIELLLSIDKRAKCFRIIAWGNWHFEMQIEKSGER